MLGLRNILFAVVACVLHCHMTSARHFGLARYYVDQCEPCLDLQAHPRTCQQHQSHAKHKIDRVINDFLWPSYLHLNSMMLLETHVSDGKLDSPADVCTMYRNVTDASLKLKIVEELTDLCPGCSSRLRPALCQLNHMLQAQGLQPGQCGCSTETRAPSRHSLRTDRTVMAAQEIHDVLNMLVKVSESLGTNGDLCFL